MQNFHPHPPMRHNTAKDAVVHQQKAALRQRLRQLRRAIPPDDAAARTRAIIARMQTLGVLERASTVHMYWPSAKASEIDLRTLIYWLRTRGKHIVLPIVEHSSGAPTMSHARFEGMADLRRNAWGILEPKSGQRVDPQEIDAVVVPAFGAGRNGHRIGYGKGYYDAFLQHLNAPLLCPIYADCLVDHCPAEPHDVRMDILVTEHEKLWPTRDNEQSSAHSLDGHA